MNLTNLLIQVQKRVDICGNNGAPFDDILQDFRINQQLALFLARSLAHKGYRFHLLHHPEPIKLTDIDNLPNNLQCFAPGGRLFYLFRGQSAFLDQFDASTASAETSILQLVAQAGPQGVITAELNRITTLRGTFHASVDRLVDRQLLCKRIVMPNTTSRSTVKPRISGTNNVLHLPVYAADYQPHLDQLTLFPGEMIRTQIYIFLRELLEENGLDYLPVLDLAAYLKVSKRYIQCLRNHCVILQRTAGSQPLPIRFRERPCTPLRPKNLQLWGKSRIAWCVEPSPPQLPPPEPILFRIRNLPLMAQLHILMDYLGSISSNDIRRYASIPRKRSAKIVETLIKHSDYIGSKVQEGKQSMYRIRRKQPKAHEPVMAIVPLSSSIVQPSTSSIMQSNDTPSQPTVQLSDVNSKSTEAANKPAALDTSISCLHLTEANSYPTASTYKSTSITTSMDMIVSANEGSSTSKPTISNRRNLLSEERKERVRLIMNYLEQQPRGITSVPEVSQYIRVQFKANGHIHAMDRKTILRAISQLEQERQLYRLVMPIPLEHEERFRDYQELELVLLFSEEPEQERVNFYLSNCQYSRLSNYKTKSVETWLMEHGDQGMVIEETGTSSNLIDVVDKDMELDKVGLVETIAGSGKRGIDETSQVETDAASKPKKRRRRKKVAVEDEQKDVNIVDLAAESSHLQDTEKESDKSLLPIVREEELPVEELVMWVDRKEHMTVSTAALERDREDKDNRLQETVEDWTLLQDGALLLSFFQNLLIRKARLGLPEVLKPIQKLKRVVGLKSLFVLFPWNSSLGIDWKDVNIALLRTYYIVNATSKLDEKTLSASRRRISNLLRFIPNLQTLITTILTILDLSQLSPATIQLINYCLQPQPNHQPQPSTEVALPSFPQLVANVFRRLGDCNANEKGCFTIQDVVPSPQQPAVFNDQLRPHYALAVKYLRELYMHGVIRGAGSEVAAETPASSSSLDTKFVFTGSYINAVFERPCGSFFFDLLAAEGELHPLVLLENNIAWQTILLCHEVCLQRIGDCMDRRFRCDFRIQSAEQGNEARESEAYPPACRLTWSEGDIEICHGLGGGNDSGPPGRALSRLTTLTSYSSSYIPLFSWIDKLQPSFGTILVPWMENKQEEAHESQLLVKVYRHFAAQVMNLLSERVAVSLDEIRNFLLVLPLDAVQELMETMERHQVVRRVSMRPCRWQRRLRSPFDSKSLWSASSSTAHSDENEETNQVYYEMNL